MLGNYKVKNAGLQPLHAQARLLAHAIGRVTFEHVARAQNAHADRLANMAMDAAVIGHQSSVVSPQSPVASRQSPVEGATVATAAHPLTPTERAVRLFVYRHFVDTARAPDLAAIAREIRIEPNRAALALRRLAELHAIVLAPASIAIWMAHPFSAEPTAYPVETSERTYWANCAWDAAGILSLLGVDGQSRTRCADCGDEIAITVRNGRTVGDGVVHFAVPPRRFWENVAYT
jgi:hypothetical protein